MDTETSIDTAMGIGEVARRTGMTERTLRFYEQQGLVSAPRDGGGRRRYGRTEIDRLYRIRLLRQLGTPVAELAGATADLTELTGRHLRHLDDQIAELARQRERVRAVEDVLVGGARPTDAALLDLLAGVAGDDPPPTRRITLLVYRDLAAAHAYLVDVLGLAPGPLEHAAGQVVHAEVGAGDGVIWLHPERIEHGLASPATLGSATACLAITVDDVQAHHSRVEALGAQISYPPTDMPYGVREYGVVDLDGHLWSFQQALTEAS